MSETTESTATPRHQQLVMWVLWFAFLQGIILFRVFLAKPLPPGSIPPPDAFPWGVSLMPALLSSVIRWQLLPRAQQAQQGLVYMILGIALAEATCFFGLFLTPSKLNLLFAASFLGVFQFAPLWARHFFPTEPQPPAQNQIPRPPR